MGCTGNHGMYLKRAELPVGFKLFFKGCGAVSEGEHQWKGAAILVFKTSHGIKTDYPMLTF